MGKEVKRREPRFQLDWALTDGRCKKREMHNSKISISMGPQVAREESRVATVLPVDN